MSRALRVALALAVVTLAVATSGVAVLYGVPGYTALHVLTSVALVVGGVWGAGVVDRGTAIGPATIAVLAAVGVVAATLPLGLSFDAAFAVHLGAGVGTTFVAAGVVARVLPSPVRLSES